jgi:mannose-6-phosphate isomerase-like protein (cupin superfamily)
MHSNSAPTSATTAEHYTWGAGCDGWHLVRVPALSVIQERMPPGAAEVRHRHAVARQFFFILTGRLRVGVEGVEYVLGPREGLEVSPGLVQQSISLARVEQRQDVRMVKARSEADLAMEALRPERRGELGEQDFERGGRVGGRPPDRRWPCRRARARARCGIGRRAPSGDGGQ